MRQALVVLEAHLQEEAEERPAVSVLLLVVV